ncbi:MAG: endonuclease/exonuclease/phosphatase family protein [Tannerellaceae bacterium]
MKALKIVIHGLFLVVNVCVVILFILSAYSDRVSPDTSLFFSYLGLGFPVFCALNLGFVFYWLFLCKWKYLLVGLCSFVICWGPVVHYFPFHSQEIPVNKEEVLKVLTYNVMNFGYKNHTEKSPNKILEYIAQSNADIVCLQEYMVSKSNDFLTSDKIFNALRMYPHHSVILLSSNKYHRFGIAVFSKYPIRNSHRVKYESDYNGSSVHELTVRGKKLTLVNNHLESFKFTTEDRTRYTAFIKNVSSDTFDGVKSAIGQKLGPAFTMRSRQAEMVAEVVKKTKNDYILVCGDFNDTPISYAHRTMQGPLMDAFSEAGRGMGVTYNQNFFWFRIDNILHSSNMEAQHCTVDKVKYSDHYPMWCYLTMK